MSRYKPYPAYKDSEVQWAVSVPTHWRALPMKHLARIRNGSDYKAVHAVDGAYPVIGSGGEFSRARDYVFDGESVLLGRKGTIDKPLHVTGRFWVVDTMFYTVIPPHTSGRFLYYSALTIPFSLYSSNTALPSMTQEVLGEHRFVAPDIVEQSAIALALDRETTRIDALIAKKARFIELLKEKRQALITHAVTQGLDPTVKMKDSGVEWIGQVPEHWSVTPIRRVARLESGHTPSRSVPAYWKNCTIPWFTLADIWQVRKEGRVVIEETSELISELGLANSSARKLPAGTVVLSRTASVGFPAILGVDMATSQDFAAWICGEKLHNRYLYLCVAAMRDELDRLNMGSTHKTIYMPDIAGFRCPLPPLPEQRKLAEHVFRGLSRIDRTIERVTLSMDLLKERRSALIAAAVTGQIDLREAA